MESNKKALWSMILGICAIPCCIGLILGPIAIVLSNQAKTEIAYSRGRQQGSGQATAGLVLGIIAIVLWTLGLLVRITQYA
jgi:hypothetical protein